NVETALKVIVHSGISPLGGLIADGVENILMRLKDVARSVPVLHPRALHRSFPEGLYAFRQSHETLDHPETDRLPLDQPVSRRFNNGEVKGHVRFGDGLSPALILLRRL